MTLQQPNKGIGYLAPDFELYANSDEELSGRSSKSKATPPHSAKAPPDRIPSPKSKDNLSDMYVHFVHSLETHLIRSGFNTSSVASSTSSSAITVETSISSTQKQQSPKKSNQSKGLRLFSFAHI